MPDYGDYPAHFPDVGDPHEVLADLYEHELPPVLADLIDDYERFEDTRRRLFWKWVHHLAPQNTLPCVEDEYATEVPIDKTIAILFIVLMDDVLEKQRDRATFQAVASIPFEWQSYDPEREDIDTEYVAFAERVWETLIDRIERGPEYEHYLDLFLYDFRQGINAIEYTDLVLRRPDLATMVDVERYESHNMVMLAYADIDLMHSPPEMGSELSTLREAILLAQQMARIGNWVATWERELYENDCSAGIIVYALERGIVDLADVQAVQNGQTEPAERISEQIREHDVVDEFLRRWEDHYNRLLDINTELTTMDLTPFIEGKREVLRYHLASTQFTNP